MFNYAYAERHSQRPNLGWTLGDPQAIGQPWRPLRARHTASVRCVRVFMSGFLWTLCFLWWHWVAPGCLFSLQGLRPLFPTRGFNPRPFTKAPGSPVLPRSVLRKQRGPSPMGLLGDWLGGGFQERTIQVRTEEAEGPREHPGDSPALCGGRVRSPLETET